MRHFEKSSCHLLDKAFEHNLVARFGSTIKSKILNLMRKNSTLKAAGSAKLLWQDYEYHCCMHKHNYVYMAVRGSKERFECGTLMVARLNV